MSLVCAELVAVASGRVGSPAGPVTTVAGDRATIELRAQLYRGM